MSTLKVDIKKTTGTPTGEHIVELKDSASKSDGLARLAYTNAKITHDWGDPTSIHR